MTSPPVDAKVAREVGIICSNPELPVLWDATFLF
jgi:hypothetical protein